MPNINLCYERMDLTQLNFIQSFILVEMVNQVILLPLLGVNKKWRVHLNNRLKMLVILIGALFLWSCTVKPSMDLQDTQVVVDQTEVMAVSGGQAEDVDVVKQTATSTTLVGENVAPSQTPGLDEQETKSAKQMEGGEPELDNSNRILADVISVQASGSEGAYQFTVGIGSPDTGCEQYADWWEVISEDGELIYRRILLHSHISEQPFVRSGGPVSISPETVVWVRAHMNIGGYGGAAFKGSVQSGFIVADLDMDFAINLAETAPLPDGCAF